MNELMESVFDREDLVKVFPNPRQIIWKNTTGLDLLLCIESDVFYINSHPGRIYLQGSVEAIWESWYTFETINSFSLCENKIMNLKINPRSKYEKMCNSYKQFDEMIKEKQNAHCPKNCSICCNDLFCITENEFIYIVASLLKANKIGVLFSAYHQALKQEAFLKENYEAVLHMINAKHDSKTKQYYNIGVSLNMLEACPFLGRNGKCKCYEARPNMCRVYGSASSCSVIGNAEYRDLASLLQENAILRMNGKVYTKQARPIYYFLKNYFSFENLKNTLKMVKLFVSTEEDLLLKGYEEESLN